jgi:hypothetical protein
VNSVTFVRKRFLHLLILYIVLACTPTFAHAQSVPAQPLIPASLYPPGSRITFESDYSNQSMDQAWNKDANGEPLMHTLSQSAFLRQSGWMEQSWVQHGNQVAWFILFDSSYGTFQNGSHGNVTAFQDLRLMLSNWWHAKLAQRQPQGILPDGTDGSAETRIIPKVDDGPFVVTSAWWGDTREVEGIAFSTPRLIHRTRLRTMLTEQVRYAVNLPATQDWRVT